MSKTISITIPDQLEQELKNSADLLGISRSRYIGNILLNWQQKSKTDEIKTFNDCENQLNGFCTELGISCEAPQNEAETCSNYSKGE